MENKFSRTRVHCFSKAHTAPYRGKRLEQAVASTNNNARYKRVVEDGFEIERFDRLISLFRL